MAEYIEREAAIAYIREQSEECQKAFEELGGESGIYADAYNDLAEDFYIIPAADVAPVVHGRWEWLGPSYRLYVWDLFRLQGQKQIYCEHDALPQLRRKDERKGGCL